ncbi:hypothetical protein [Fredinandcohnia sp. 179-A 10B2 NHS]|uniref:hypothetical protein n=1 Tax=Fredinandcohnia sp. 179-A 10B2 NHS TaxID=3235176 RepID=UPI0039A015B4
MKSLIFFCFTLFLFITLVGCGGASNEPVQSGSTATMNAEITKEDLVYRLVSDKDSYQEGEKVKIHAELEYIGELDSITIYHAASPFYFDITEKSRGYEIEYAMNEPLLSTTLQKGEPYREEYVKSGGFSDQDPPDYVSFMKRFFEEEGFPVGQYEINGSARFYTGENEKKDYTIEARISFNVN